MNARARARDQSATLIERERVHKRRHQKTAIVCDVSKTKLIVLAAAVYKRKTCNLKMRRLKFDFASIVFFCSLQLFEMFANSRARAALRRLRTSSKQEARAIRTSCISIGARAPQNLKSALVTLHDENQQMATAGAASERTGERGSRRTVGGGCGDKRGTCSFFFWSPATTKTTTAERRAGKKWRAPPLLRTSRARVRAHARSRALASPKFAPRRSTSRLCHVPRLLVCSTVALIDDDDYRQASKRIAAVAAVAAVAATAAIAAAAARRHTQQQKKKTIFSDKIAAFAVVAFRTVVQFLQQLDENNAALHILAANLRSPNFYGRKKGICKLKKTIEETLPPRFCSD